MMRTSRWITFALVAATPLFVSGDASAGPPDPPAGMYQLAAGYAAKEACSCSFVEGQTDAYCTNYGVSPTGLDVTLTIDHATSSVTATVLSASRTATFTAGKGCVLAGL